MNNSVKSQLLHGFEYFKDHIPFYSNLLKSYKFSLNDDNVMEFFLSLPIVDKKVIKNNIISFVTTEIKENNLLEIIDLNKDYTKEYWYEVNGFSICAEFTSGSNGTPFLSIKSNSERIVIGKQLWKLRNKLCEIKQNEMFMFLHDFSGNDYPFPFPPPKDFNVRLNKELEYLKKSKYKMWHATTKHLQDYFLFLEDNKYTFPNLHVIENNGEYISDNEKLDYGSMFNCKIANNYGCREVWTIAYDCPCGYLHVNEENVYLELVDENNNIITEPDCIGNVIVTSLKQKLMPFIRYRLGDYACYVDGICECGNTNKRIRLLPGRNLILGTNFYGNRYFRYIMLLLTRQYHICKFDSISIVQTDELTFTVNVKGNKESREILENKFIESANSALTNSKYQYKFTYNDNLVVKDFFSVKKSNDWKYPSKLSNEDAKEY